MRSRQVQKGSDLEWIHFVLGASCSFLSHTKRLVGAAEQLLGLEERHVGGVQDSGGLAVDYEW